MKLSARHEGNQVCICVEDDGRGLDVQEIKEGFGQKLLRKSIGNYGRTGVLNLIFEPGFSMAKKLPMFPVGELV